MDEHRDPHDPHEQAGDAAVSGLGAVRRRHLLLNTEDVRGYPVTLRGELSYCAADDPWAVRLTLPGGVAWLVGRDLLAAGTTGDAGEGDVRLRPAGGAVVIELCGPSGTAELRMDAGVVSDFLASTYSQCPPGNEHRWVDLDALAASLLDEAEGGGRRG